MNASMEERLKRRKLDALRRGVHRASSGEALPIATHVVGIGKAGVGAIAEILRSLEPDAPKITALAIDIGDQDLAELRAVAASVPAERAEVMTVPLDVPQREDLLDALGRYREFLTLEYPLHRWNSGAGSWLPSVVEMPEAGSHIERAIAKAICGYAYYAGERALERALRRFAERIDTDRAQAVIAIVFGLGGGTGGGIAVDVARHLSAGLLGRRVLVAGIGVAPCDGDGPEHKGGHLFAVLNELDCLCDEDKNRGIVQSCGDLFKNPFTAGFIVLPQQHVWAATKCLAEAQRRGNQEIAALLTCRGGLSLWEMLRLLNWVAAPSTQHSAARTPWGPRWIHMLGFADTAGEPIALDPRLSGQLGIRAGYAPEFIEMRVPNAEDQGAAALASVLEKALAPDVPPQIVGGGRDGSVQFILPRLCKTDLSLFFEARDAYDAEQPEQKLLDHSLLLEQGVLLSEPSTRLEGMAGASLAGRDGWIAVPLAALRGEGEAALRQVDAA